MRINSKFSIFRLTESNSSRMIQLDILRGIAIVLVIFAHSVLPTKESGFLSPVLGYLQYLGPTGVDLFFVLSGFLVGGLLLKEVHDKNHLDVRRFLIRRGFKIFPSYFVFLFFVFFILIFLNHLSFTESFLALMPNFVHLQNYLGSPREHTWSLAVEEHFYLILPFLVLLLTMRRETKIKTISLLPFICLSVFIICALLRLYTYTYPSIYNPHFLTHLRVDSLFFGVMLAYFYHFKPEKLQLVALHRTKLMIFGSILLLLSPVLVIKDKGNLIVGTIGFIILYIAYGCFLLAMIYTPVGSDWLGKWFKGYSARILAFIGFFSYPIYLWHLDAVLPLRMLLNRFSLNFLPSEIRWITVFVISVIISTAVGVVFGILLEKPSLSLRNRLFPSRTGSPVQSKTEQENQAN